MVSARASRSRMTSIGPKPSISHRGPAWTARSSAATAAGSTRSHAGPHWIASTSTRGSP